MWLDLKIKYRKMILNICASIYGINHKNTQRASEKVDKLINEYYRKHR